MLRFPSSDGGTLELTIETRSVQQGLPEDQDIARMTDYYKANYVDLEGGEEQKVRVRTETCNMGCLKGRLQLTHSKDLQGAARQQHQTEEAR